MIISKTLEREMTLLNLGKENIPQILSWYNQTDEFMFATGIDSLISEEYLLSKFFDTCTKDNMILLGIYTKFYSTPLGFIYGKINSGFLDTFWINILIIDKQYRHLGLGSESLMQLFEILIKRGIKKVFTAIIDENKDAIYFWKSQHFNSIFCYNKYLKLKDRKYNILIMKKEIGGET